MIALLKCVLSFNIWQVKRPLTLSLPRVGTFQPTLDYKIQTFFVNEKLTPISDHDLLYNNEKLALIQGDMQRKYTVHIKFVVAMGTQN